MAASVSQHNPGVATGPWRTAAASAGTDEPLYWEHITHVGAEKQVRELGLPSTCCLESDCSQKSLLESNMGKRESKRLQSLLKWLASRRRPLKGHG